MSDPREWASGRPPEASRRIVPIRRGRCEFELWSPRVQAKVWCGKAGRWIVDGLVRCGEHKAS